MKTCLECLSDNLLKGKALLKSIEDSHPNFGCEVECCSLNSPGPVSDEEELCFFLIDPNHFDDIRKQITPTAVKELTNRDLSVFRKSVSTQSETDATKADLIQRGKDKLPPESRNIDKVSMFSAKQIRQLTLCGDRIAAVYDTGLVHNRGHAGIFTKYEFVASDSKAAKKVRKQIRQLCVDLLNQRIEDYDLIRVTLSP